MIFKITPENDVFLGKIYKDSMKELNAFYGINWVHHLPKIIVVDNRKTINLLKQKKTDNWVVGWANGRDIYILNRKYFEKESCHKYDPKQYPGLIKHEFSHAFFRILSDGHEKPIWLNEGLAIYTSGQNEFKWKPEKFKKFLKFYNDGGKEVYREAGFFIEFLIKKFGKKKLLNLVKNLENIETKSKFEKHFKKEYGFNLIYSEINSNYIK